MRSTRNALPIIPTKCIPQPVQLRRLRVAVGFDHVEAACRIGILAMEREELLRGVDELAAFGDGDRRGTATEPGVAAITHFDEDQRRTAASAVVQPAFVKHHQVEFAAAIVRVGRNFAQSFTFQVGERSGFDRRAACARTVDENEFNRRRPAA